MQKSYVTNNNFRNIFNQIADFLDNGQEPPEDLFMEFIGELKYSNLIVPGIIDGDDLISETLTSYDDGSVVVPLYTDDDEFFKDKGYDSEYDPIPNDIGFYLELLNDNHNDGIIINRVSECFFIPIDLLNNLPLNSGITFEDNFTGYDPEKLFDLAENISNDSLVDFIQDPYNQDDFEGLTLELSKSVLLNVIVSDENLDIYADNGIIYREDVDSFDVCNINDEDDEYGMLFTSKDAILSSMDNNLEFNYYYQVAVTSKFFEYVLRHDLNGVIINPNVDDYFILRKYLFDYSNILDNPGFKRGMDYAFLL